MAVVEAVVEGDLDWGAGVTGVGLHMFAVEMNIRR